MMANLVVPISQTVTTYTIQITTDIPLTGLWVSMIGTVFTTNSL
jgi:hypothetical protein